MIKEMLGNTYQVQSKQPANCFCAPTTPPSYLFLSPLFLNFAPHHLNWLGTKSSLSLFFQVGVVSSLPLCAWNISCFFLDCSSSFQSCNCPSDLIAAPFCLRFRRLVPKFHVTNSCSSCLTSMWSSWRSFFSTEQKGMMTDVYPSKKTIPHGLIVISSFLFFIFLCMHCLMILALQLPTNRKRMWSSIKWLKSCHCF